MRQEKEKFAPEKRLLEHLRAKLQRKLSVNHKEQTCQLCHTLAVRDIADDFGTRSNGHLNPKGERRVVEIDTINEHFDDLIDHRNAQMTGHTVALVSFEKKKKKYFLAKKKGRHIIM